MLLADGPAIFRFVVVVVGGADGADEVALPAPVVCAEVEVGEAVFTAN